MHEATLQKVKEHSVDLRISLDLPVISSSVSIVLEPLLRMTFWKDEGEKNEDTDEIRRLHLVMSWRQSEHA